MRRIIIILVLLISTLPISAHAQPKKLFNFTLDDPRGTPHSASTLLKQGGMVLVVTAPTYHDKTAQEGWDKYLVETMPHGKGILVFIEDMSASDWKGIARKDMKKDWQPGVPPLLLIDEKGTVRTSLGVGRDETAVMVYDKTGSLLYTERGSPSAAKAKLMWSKLQ